MATKKSAAKKTAEIATVIALSEIVAAGANGLFTPAAVHDPLVEAGLVEINPAMTNENGEIATRATQAGIESLDSGAIVVDNETTEANSETAETGKIEKVKTMFKIEDNISVPTISGRGRTGAKYPFEQLEVGQSFFVEGEKTIAPSTISAATARYAVPAEDGSTKTNKAGESVPVMVKTRIFFGRKVEENGVKGVRVWRTA